MFRFPRHLTEKLKGLLKEWVQPIVPARFLKSVDYHFSLKPMTKMSRLMLAFSPHRESGRPGSPTAHPKLADLNT
jgi:hypothetical protein